MHIPKWLIATAALLCVVMIAAIAFFIGRETSRPQAAGIAAPAVPQEPAAVRESAPEESKLPVAAAPGPSNPIITAPVNGTASSGATPSSAVASAAASTNPQAAETHARVAAYFEQMEALRSAGTGDQEEFATTIVNAAVSGDFSAIDALIRTAGDAERRAAALQPPGECVEYHRLAVTLLGDSKTMIIAIRDGLKRNDADALTSMAASAQGMKSRSENLSKAEQALRARFGL